MHTLYHILKLSTDDLIQEKEREVDVYPIVKAKKDLQLGRWDHSSKLSLSHRILKKSSFRGIVAIAADDSGIRLNPTKKDVFWR